MKSEALENCAQFKGIQSYALNNVMCILGKEQGNILNVPQVERKHEKSIVYTNIYSNFCELFHKSFYRLPPCICYIYVVYVRLFCDSSYYEHNSNDLLCPI